MIWLGPLSAGVLVVVAGFRLRPAARPADPTVRHLGRSVRSGPVRWIGAGVVLVASYGAFGLVGVLVVGAGAAGFPHLMRHRRRSRAAREVDAAHPELVELFVVAASAGLPVATALAAVAERAPQPVRAPVAAATLRFERGIPLGECLTDLGSELGPAGEPLVAALLESLVSGAPLALRLAAVADRAGERRRQRALEAARRLPVTMLFPLVGCILPAAIVLAVVPVVLVSFSALAP